MQRTALVVGVANRRSLAWSSTLSLLQGDFDHVIVTYQNERFQKSIQDMVHKQNEIYANLSIPKTISSLSCDVTNEHQVSNLFSERIPSLLHQRNEQVQAAPLDGHELGLAASNPSTLDALVHSVAYAPAEAMKSSSDSPLLDTTLESFQIAHSTSSHSLITLSKHALPLLSLQQDGTTSDPRSPSITTLTYLGSTRVVPHYNVMGPAKASLEACVRGLAMELSSPPHGIRVNAVSAGPINTLSARGIRNFNEMKHDAEQRSLIKRSVTGEEVGNLVAFVAGRGASGITGQVLFCDGGYNVFGG